MASVPQTVFHFDDGRPAFEDLGQGNGITHWDEEILREALGYEPGQGFTRAVMRAKQACLSLGIQCEEHFVMQPNGKHAITRFGCYLVAMNGSPKKPQVAAAQAYFAAIAATFQSHLEHANAIERVLIRDDIREGEKALADTAQSHGVEKFGFFQNAGYRGMYNMSLGRLRQLKGLGDGQILLDWMGKTELAANLFRITQTEEQIRNRNIRGQAPCEDAAYDVGRAVRSTMIRLGGTAPEDLPISEQIRDVRKKLRGAQKQLEHNPTGEQG
jgi:DNA-damage-inducible protein D